MGRTVVPGEPLWNDDDRSWALALLAEEAEECPSCGGALEETTDPENEQRYRSSIVRCHRCTEQLSAAHAHHESKAAPGFLVRTDLPKRVPTLTDGGLGG